MTRHFVELSLPGSKELKAQICLDASHLFIAIIFIYDKKNLSHHDRK
jgi:hypothetical protein